MSWNRWMVFLRTNICASLFVWAAVGWTVCAAAQTTISQKDWTFGHEGFNLLIQETGLEICDLSRWFGAPQDQRVVIAINHRSRSLRAFGGSVPVYYSSTNRAYRGVQFGGGRKGGVSTRLPDCYFENYDCPIVRPDSNHPVFAGVDRIITNRPSYISQIDSQVNSSDVQYFPPKQTGWPSSRFSVIDERNKRFFTSDPNLFSNQMLFKGDNLLLAENALRWLTDDFHRKSVLLLINGRLQRSIDESELEVETPVPRPEEVLAALQNLPPEKVLEFSTLLLGQANEVAAVVEDEQLLNDLAHRFTDDLRTKAVHRMILLTLFGTCCLFGFIAYFWQRKLLRKTSIDIMSKRQKTFATDDGSSDATERQMAASLILNSFCLDVANRRLSDWADFPAPLDTRNELVAQQATHEMADAFWALKTKPKSFWTPQQLQQLEAATIRWRHLIQNMQPD